MKNLKTILLILALTCVGVLCALIYWNSHLYNKAEKIEESERKIETLEGAMDFFPSNDLIFYELGRAYFNLGIYQLSDRAKSEEYLQKSVKHFRKSLRNNPSSYYGHFYLAQSLLYLSYFSPASDVNPFDEFKKAASLAGENSQIYYEVSKIFLSHWSHLSDEDKDFALEILRKVAGRKDKERILSLLRIWEMNVKDYPIIESMLPEDQQIYRIYADFLAEKSLSLQARLRSLCKVEFLEFQRAKEKYKEGEQEFFSYRMKEAFGHFHSCLNILERIKFYQDLTSQNLISRYEFNELKRATLLNSVKCQIELQKGLIETENYLLDYLSLEGREEAIKKLENYLKKRQLISDKIESSFNDLYRLYFQLLLCFNQSQYKDIMRVGRKLKQSFVVVPENKKRIYIRILNLIGDSYQQINYVYDAKDFYQRSLEIDPDNLETLLRIRSNYKRLRSDEEIRNTSEKIEKILSPREKIFKNSLIKKNRDFSQTLILDGRKVTIDLHFDFDEREILPLVSVFFNGIVVWEDYLKDKILSLSLNTKIGKNSLNLIPLNRDIHLNKLAYH